MRCISWRRRNKPYSLAILAWLTLGAISALSAQDLALTNARIVVANGTVIERGSIVVRAGKIVSVAAGAPAVASGRQEKTIDAKGKASGLGKVDLRHMGKA